MRKLFSLLVISLCASLMEVAAQETYTVTIGSAKYSTLYLDQPLNLESFGDDLKAYTVTQVRNGVAIITRCVDIPSYTPVLLHATSAGVYNIPIEKSYSYYTSLLKGVLEDTEIPSTTIVNNVEKTNLVLSVGVHGVGFYTVSKETFTIPANKCYLQVKTSALGSSSNSNCIGLMEEETDAISDAVSSTTSVGPWYTLQGQRVDKPSSLGIYIHNGKKIIVK